MTCSEGVVCGAAPDSSVEDVGIDPSLTDGAPVQLAHAGVCHRDEGVLTGGIVPPPEANIRGVIAHAS